MTTRVNLLPDPSLRSGGTTHFAALGGAELEYTTEYAYYGSGALKVIKADINNSGVTLAAPVSVRQSETYAFSWHLRLPLTIPAAAPADVVLRVEWLNSFGTVIDINQSTVLSMTDDQVWYRIGGVWTAPIGATLATMEIIQPLPGESGEAFIVDAAMIEKAKYIGGFFDNLPQAAKNTIVNNALSATPQVINGIRLGADIVFNDLILNTVDENDTVWVCTELDGWWGQTNPELPDIPRGTEDGSYDVEGRLTSRTIILTGIFIPKDNEASLSASIDRLVTAMNLVRKGGWLIANEGINKAAWVRLAAKPTVQTVNARGRTEFQITLKAGDPNKYHWDDNDPEGYTNIVFNASDVVSYATNIGTAEVAGMMTLTGPAGAGTRIYNALTDETMVLQQALRGSGVVASAYQVEATNGIATVYTTEPHHLRVGDRISLLNMVIPFSASDQERTITHVSDVFPYSVSFAIPTDDIDMLATSGQIFLVNNDVLEIDTYNRSVMYNGESVGHRSKLTTLTDWIHFGPGTNPIEFYDQVSEIEVVSKELVDSVVTLTTQDIHYLIPGEEIEVDLPVEVPLYRKRLVGNEVTLTTLIPHGFSEGDVIDVESTETATVAFKARTANEATLTTEDPHGVAIGDQIVVNLPTNVAPVQKSLTANEATLTTQNPHGYSEGDTVTVSLPASANITNKALTANQVTLTTSGPHHYAVGDRIRVTLPTNTTVTGKARSGSQVIITTSANHGYSVGDAVVMSLPTTLTPTGNRTIDGTTNLVTVNTSTAHGMSVGDAVTVNFGLPTSYVVSNRVATTTECTLTTSAVHRVAVGEKITVSGVGTRFNGTFYVTAVTSNTITYSFAGTALASSASTGSIVSVTNNQYYNGDKIVETIPSTTSFTYRAWDQEVNTTSSQVSSPSIVNMTNQLYNGTRTIVSISSTTFSFNL